MIYGIGTDLLYIDTISVKTLQPADPFFQSTYTGAEQSEGGTRDRPEDYYRTRFAGKEAVFKALRLEPNQLKQWNQIEILSEENGAPQVYLHGDIKKIALREKVERIHLSLSYDNEYILAFCIAIKAD